MGQLKTRLAHDPGAVGDTFRAGAVRESTEAFGDLVRKVDFPAFVSGLVQGVFQAVVNASIQQMEAYGELLSACAKTAEQFADENVSDAQARDWVANRHPSLVVLDTGGERAVLRRNPNAPDDSDIAAAMRLRDSVDLDNPEEEAALVTQARLEMARQRQQMLATMVLLGINRIVVTNGQIHAKVLFEVEADDHAKRRARAELKDEQASRSSSSAGIGGAVGWIGGGASYASSNSHKTTVASATDDSSDARAQAKAQLTGEVKLSFKSETFPLERMVDAMGIQTLNARAAPGAGPVPPGSPGFASNPPGAPGLPPQRTA